MPSPKYFRLTAGTSEDSELFCAYFETREDAERAVKINNNGTSFVSYHILNDRYSYDYYNIVDMREYIYGEPNHDASCYVELGWLV
jgi:hypothetical protein